MVFASATRRESDSEMGAASQLHRRSPMLAFGLGRQRVGLQGWDLRREFPRLCGAQQVAPVPD